MRRAFADCCKRCALEIVGSDATADEERDKGLVQSLLDFKDSMETCVRLHCHAPARDAAPLCSTCVTQDG